MKQLLHALRIALILLLAIGILAAVALAEDRVVTSQDEIVAALADENCDRIVIEGGRLVTITQQITMTKNLLVRALDGQEGFTCLKITAKGSLTLGESATLQTVSQVNEFGVPVAQGLVWLESGTLDLSKGTVAPGSNFFRTNGALLYEGSTEGLWFDQSVTSEQGLKDALEDKLCTYLIIQKDFTITQDLTLTKSALVNDGATLAIPDGVTLTVPEGIELIAADGRLDVKGEITGGGNWTGKGEEMPAGTVIVRTVKELDIALNDPDCTEILITGPDAIHVPDGTTLNVGKPIHCVATWDDGVFNKLIVEQGATLSLSKGGVITTVGPDDYGLSRVVVFGKLNAASGTIPDKTNIVFYPDDKADLQLPPGAAPTVDYVVKTQESFSRALEDGNCSLIIVENGGVLELDAPFTLTKDLAVLAGNDPDKETAVILKKDGVLTVGEGVTIRTMNTFDEGGFPKGIAEIRLEGGALLAQNAKVEEKTRFYVADGALQLPADATGLEVIYEANDLAGLNAALNEQQCTDIAIRGSFALERDLTLTKSAMIDDNCTVTVPEGVTLTVAKDAMLIYFSESNLVVNGTITGDGWWPGKPETPALKPGDVNGDDAVNAKDVTVLRRAIAGGYDVTVVEGVTDINKDGAVNAKDVTVLRRYIAGGYDVTLGE